MVRPLMTTMVTICTSIILVNLFVFINPNNLHAAFLSWNTFLGGNGGDGADDVTLDSNRNIYVTAYCDANWGTPILPYTAGADLSISKLDPNGTPVWHTFLGGTGTDFSTGIAYSAFDNHIYIAGMSNATWGTPLQAYGGDYDGFVAKLDLDGNLIWHTFIGGGGRDRGRGLDINQSNGDIYITGDSDTTWGSPVQAFTSGVNIFIARLTNNGTLVWSTFTAGNGVDNGVGGISLDGSANSHIVGYSNGTWGTPVRPYSGNNYDAYAAKIDSNGFYVWNTFLGGPGAGTGNDYGSTVKTDGAGNVYALGNSGDTWGTPLEAHHSGTDGFITKLNTAGALQWHTFIGGTGSDTADRMHIPGDGYLYLDGKSTATWGSPSRAYTAGEDAFFLKISDAGTYNWHMFLGGSGDDFGTGVVLDGLGHIVVTGASNATWGSPLNAYTLGTDSFIVKIDESFISPTITETYTITASVTPSSTSTPAGALTLTNTRTITPTPTITPSTTPTFAAALTLTNTWTTTPTPSITPVLSQTSSPSLSPTATISPTPSFTVPAESPLISKFIIYPNPFRAPGQSAILQYSLTKDATITIKIYTYLGSEIRSVNIQAGQIGAQGQPGGHINQFTWDGRNQRGLLQSSGGYICKIIAESKNRKEATTLKVSLIR